MSTITQELKIATNIPEAYTSGFTFFKEDSQKDMSELTPRELAILIGRWPRSSGRFVHELWRTGRLEIVYGFFVLPDQCRPEEIREEDVMFDSAIMMKKGEVSLEELNAYITDLCNASQNAHDNQSFGEEPQNPDAVRERIERIMIAIVNAVPTLPE